MARYESGRGRQVCRLATAAGIPPVFPDLPAAKCRSSSVPRVVAGALSGVTVAAAGVSVAAGVVGAIVGTFGGASLRAPFAAFFGKDRPAALIEDVVAILAVLLIVSVP